MFVCCVCVSRICFAFAHGILNDFLVKQPKMGEQPQSSHTIARKWHQLKWIRFYFANCVISLHCISIWKMLLFYIFLSAIPSSFSFCIFMFIIHLRFGFLETKPNVRWRWWHNATQSSHNTQYRVVSAVAAATQRQWTTKGQIQRRGMTKRMKTINIKMKSENIPFELIGCRLWLWFSFSFSFDGKVN